MEGALHHVDFSSLSPEEAITLQKVLQRQKEFEEINGIRRRDLRLELLQFEERLALAEKNATDKQLCQICFKTKVAECLRLYCTFCTRKTCSRCGKRELGRKNWMCLLCSKKRYYLTCTGEWYVGDEPLFPNAQFFLDKLEERSAGRMECCVMEPPHFATNTTANERLQSFSSRGTSEGDTQDANADAYSFCNEPEYLSLPVHEPRRHSLSDLSTESEFTSCFSVSTHSDNGMPALNVVEPTDSESDESSISSGNKKVVGRRIKKMEEFRTSKGRPMIERLTFSREVSELASKGAAFGLRVVGGKTSNGGIIGAFVVGLIPGTKAHKLLSIGDQIIEWNHISLVDATFEGTHEAIASSSDDVSIVVCHVSKEQQSTKSPRPSCSQIVRDAIEKRRASFAREAKSCTSQDELLKLILSRSDTSVSDCRLSACSLASAGSNNQRKRSLLSYSCGEKRRSGVKISLWHDPGGPNLIIKILEAQSLPLGVTPGDELPNPYAVVNLLPIRNVSSQLRTNVNYQTVAPVWNLTFIYSNITEKELSSRSLEVTLWSELKTRRHRFLGKIKVDLNDNILSNLPQWYYLEDTSVDEIAIPIIRRHTISSREDAIKCFVGINELAGYSNLKQARSCFALSCKSRRTSADELLSDMSDGCYRRRRTDSFLLHSKDRARSLSPCRLLQYKLQTNDELTKDALRTRVEPSPPLDSGNANWEVQGETRRGCSRARYGSESLFRFRINSTGKKLMLPSVNSAPSTPCHSAGAFDKSPRFEYFPAPLFDYSNGYATQVKGQRLAVSKASGSCQAWHNPELVRDVKDRETQEIVADQFQDKNEDSPQNPSTNKKQDSTVGAEKEVTDVKQKKIQKISFKLHESSDTEYEKREKTISRHGSSVERSHTASKQRKISADSFSFGEDPEPGTIGPSQIHCHDVQEDLGYLRLGLSVMCGILEVDIIRALLRPSSGSSQPETYVKTYLIYDEKKLLKRKSSTVRQDLNPVYNCKVKYAARDVDNKVLNVSIWQKHGIFGRNAPVGEGKNRYDGMKIRIHTSSKV